MLLHILLSVSANARARSSRDTINMNTTVSDVICLNSTYPVDCVNASDDPISVHDAFRLPWWQQTIFYAAFLVITVISAGGNLIVIWIVLAHKPMRSVTNYFLVNLAIADFLISILNMPFTVIFSMYQNWWFGNFFCIVSLFISPCTISVSVLTFMAIAIDRYVVFCTLIINSNYYNRM